MVLVVALEIRDLMAAVWKAYRATLTRPTPRANPQAPRPQTVQPSPTRTRKGLAPTS